MVRKGLGEKTREGCIRIGGFDEFVFMNAANKEIEVLAYSAASARGDLFPVCMRLTSARAEADWTLRSELVRACGPLTPQATLDRACEYMPDAPEPRLLRAARSIAIADLACGSLRRDWLAFAHRDLVDAMRMDPMDSTARCLLSELVGARAWGAIAPSHALAA